MELFKKAEIVIDSERDKKIIEILKEDFGISDAEALQILNDSRKGQVYKNNVYQVIVRDDVLKAPDIPDMVWLSIKRIDQAPIHDWRDLQQIKNMLVGPECEGVEIYPAESRLTDTSNQYHLWVFKSPNNMIPFGFFGPRNVSDSENAAKIGAKQRDFQ